MKKFLACFFFLMFLMGLNAAANALILTNVDGDWTNPVGGADIDYRTVSVDYRNGSEDQIRWGIPASTEGEQSGLGFTGAAGNGVAQTIVSGDPFEIGQLRHFNSIINLNSAISAVDLQTSMTFTDPEGSDTRVVTLEVNETTNATGDPVRDADYVYFPTGIPDETFTIDSETYTLSILGFGTDADLYSDQIATPEGETSSSLLYGKITIQQPVEPPSGGNGNGQKGEPIPEPTTLLLMTLGLVGLSGYGKKLLNRA